MAVFKCKMCGGDLEITAGESVAECQYCGSKQTLPRFDSERKANLYDRANHFRRNNEFDKAEGIYEQILNEDLTDAEAYWSLVLCRYGIEYVEDPATHKRIPTVNRAQYTSVFADENYKKAVEYAADTIQRELYEAEAKAIDEIQRGILEISEKEDPFDVFICYKETDAQGRRTPDSVLANELYHELTNEGFKVFFSRITLEDKLGTAYEPYIFAALHSAKVMVVLGTKPEYFNAVWVKNEWSRYLALIRSGEKKTLIPAYRDMDPYDLPEEFSHLQAQDMSKLGFMPDLVRGIRKIVEADKQKDTVKETVVIQQVVQQSADATNVAPLLKRAFMFLEDGEWHSADEYCERVLDQDPENALAYLGKLMAELKVRQRSELAACGTQYGGNSNYKKALRFGDAELKKELEDYHAQNSACLPSTPAMAFEFAANDSGFSVQKLLDDGLNEVVIPRQFRGTPVTAIGDEAFKKCSSLISVTIPDGVTTIGEGAFLGCENLTDVTIPDSVTSIGEYAFSGCEKLTNVMIPYTVTSIVERAFQLCKSLMVVTIPDGVTSIGEGAFSRCENLTDVTIPDSVTSIGESAFSGCKNLSNVMIPDSVTSIGDFAFLECEKLADENGFVIIRDVLYSYCGSAESVKIPDGVTSIGGGAFEDRKSIKNVMIPNSLTSIGDSAFYGCENLTDIIIPDSVTSINENAFSMCKNLINLTIPDSVTSIGGGAFWWCENLSSITIPESVTSIGDGAFCGCEKLADENGFVIIRDVLHFYCGSAGSVTIPDGVNSIGRCAFSFCEGLTSVTIPDGVISIGDSAFGWQKSLTDVTIPDSVTSIGDSAFRGCKNLATIICTGDSSKLKTAFEKTNNNKDETSYFFACLERGDKKAQSLLMESRRAKGLCPYCGGTFKKSLLSTKCMNCGRKKDY